MNIRALLKQRIDGKRPAETAGCPGEAHILAYTEGRLSPGKQAGLEMHLAKCDDCRELLAFASKECPDGTSAESVSEKAVKQQTARVLAYIEQDESRLRTNQQSANPGLPWKGLQRFFFGDQILQTSTGSRTFSSLSIPILAFVALVVCAVGAVSVFWMTRDKSSDEALAALRLAMKDERRNQALISGDIDHSHYLPMRGGEETDDLNYDRALNKLKFAYEETAPAESRLLLARVLVSTAKRENTRKALSILAQLEAVGIQTPELFNDRGVAELQLGRYAEAVDYFTRATQGAPDNSRFLFNKALAEQMAGRTDEARQDWNHFISIASDERLKDEGRDQLDSLR